MFKVFNLASVTIAMMAIGITSALANPVTQAKPNPSVGNSLEINLSDQIKPMLPKVENRQFQRKQLLTPLMLTFDTPEDYEAFASGKWTTNLILKNTSSGQTKTIESIMLQDNFRAYRKAHRPAKVHTMTIGIIIDDLIEPIMSAGEVKLSVEDLPDDRGGNIILTYSGLGSRFNSIKGGPIRQGKNLSGNLMVVNRGDNQVITQASVEKLGLGSRSAQANQAFQSCATPIKGVIVKGGRNPSGNIVAITVGDNQIMTKASAEKFASKEGALIIQSSKSKGSPKAQGF